MLFYTGIFRNIYQVNMVKSYILPVLVMVNSIYYRQMGELWTLFEFACSLYLTCNMVLDMDGSISRVL